MPQTKGVLNALAALAQLKLRIRRRRKEACESLESADFLRHAAALVAESLVPNGLWLSLLVDPSTGAKLAHKWLKHGLAELVVAPADRVGLADALARARAPFVARLEAGGTLAPFAVERIAAALAERPDAEMLYTDEILTDAAGRPSEVVLKPAFDPILLDSFDYLGRLTVFRRTRAAALGGWGGGSPAEDYALALRIIAEAPPGSIWHLPYPAFVGPARAFDSKAGAAAISARHRAEGREISFAPGLAPDRLRPVLRPEPRSWPKISVIVPSRDAPALIAKTLEGLFEATDYPDLEVIVVDNGTTDPATLATYAAWRERGANFRVETKPEAFNFSRAINRGFALSRGALALLLNNDVEVVEAGWLKEMAGCFDYPDVGVVGAKLLYPDLTLQHAGVIAGLGDYAGHWHIGKPGDYLGPQRRLAARQSLSVVTGACMLVSRACFERVGGLDEAEFPIAYNDVDFCLRAGGAGFRVVWTPFATLLHHESASRGSDETEANRARFERDKAALRARHATDRLQDRAYNPWAARGHSDPRPERRATLPHARA